MLATTKYLAKHALGAVVDLALPPTCPAQGQGEIVLGLSEGARLGIARLATQNFCIHCGLSTGPHEVHDARNPCGRCGERDVGVARLARVGTFSEPLVALVHQLKFGRGGGRGSWELARILAPFVYQAMVRVSEAGGVGVDVIVPVPLHWTRAARRGFNQAEELAREVGRLSGWKVYAGLKRVRRTQQQARMDYRAQRLENLRGAFALKRPAEKKLAGKHVWLMDDVTTTGATLHAAATALRKLARGCKPASINAAVVCVTEFQSPSPLQEPG